VNSAVRVAFEVFVEKTDPIKKKKGGGATAREGEWACEQTITHTTGGSVAGAWGGRGLTTRKTAELGSGKQSAGVRLWRAQHKCPIELKKKEREELGWWENLERDVNRWCAGPASSLGREGRATTKFGACFKDHGGVRGEESNALAGPNR